MFKWMCEATKKDEIRNEYIRGTTRVNTNIQKDNRETIEMVCAYDEKERFHIEKRGRKKKERTTR